MQSQNELQILLINSGIGLMYWLTKIRDHDKEKTIGVTLSESEAVRWLEILTKSGFCPAGIRTIPRHTSKDEVRGNGSRKA